MKVCTGRSSLQWGPGGTLKHLTKTNCAGEKASGYISGVNGILRGLLSMLYGWHCSGGPGAVSTAPTLELIIIQKLESGT